MHRKGAKHPKAFLQILFLSFNRKIEDVFITSSHILTNSLSNIVSLHEWVHAEIIMEEHLKRYRRVCQIFRNKFQ